MEKTIYQWAYDFSKAKAAYNKNYNRPTWMESSEPDDWQTADEMLIHAVIDLQVNPLMIKRLGTGFSKDEIISYEFRALLRKFYEGGMRPHCYFMVNHNDPLRRERLKKALRHKLHDIRQRRWHYKPVMLFAPYTGT